MKNPGFGRDFSSCASPATVAKRTAAENTSSAKPCASAPKIPTDAASDGRSVSERAFPAPPDGTDSPTKRTSVTEKDFGTNIAPAPPSSPAGLQQRPNDETTASFRRPGHRTRRIRPVIGTLRPAISSAQKRSVTEPTRSSSATENRTSPSPSSLSEKRNSAVRSSRTFRRKAPTHRKRKTRTAPTRSARLAKCNPPFFHGTAAIPERPVPERHTFPQETKREAQPFRHPLPACLTGTKPPCRPSQESSHCQTHPQQPVPAGTTASETKKRRNSPSFSSRTSGRATLRRSGSRS